MPHVDTQLCLSIIPPGLLVDDLFELFRNISSFNMQERSSLKSLQRVVKEIMHVIYKRFASYKIEGRSEI